MDNIDSNSIEEIFEKELSSLQKSVNNHIEAINRIYLILETNIIKENSESVKSFMEDKKYDIFNVDKGEILQDLDKSFDFKESILNSLFFMAISIVENALRKVELIIEDKGIALQKCKRKIRGSNINKMFKCINKTLGISKSYPEWAKLIDYYIIRNSLIHNSGILGCKYRSITKKYKLEYDDFFNVTIINEGFLLQVCKDINDFFKSYLIDIKNNL